MSKKSTSITLDEETIQIVEEMREKEKIKPSFSEMAEYLIKTNTAYMKQEMSRRSFKRPDKKKNEN